MATAIEDAGFELRDCLGWIFGSGFPKSHNISKAIDNAEDYKLQSSLRRAAIEAVEAAGLTLPGNSRHDWTKAEHAPGDKWWAEFQRWLPTLSDADRERVEGEIVATVQKAAGWFTSGNIYQLRAPATEEAREWEGWGTALKPAWEMIYLARKPLSEKSIAANCLRWGTGALNIDRCRVGTEGGTTRGEQGGSLRDDKQGFRANSIIEPLNAGRWPANLCLSYPDEEYELAPTATKDQRRELYGWFHANT